MKKQHCSEWLLTVHELKWFNLLLKMGMYTSHVHIHVHFQMFMATEEAIFLSLTFNEEKRDREITQREQEIFLFLSFSLFPLMWAHLDLCLLTFQMLSLTLLLFKHPNFTFITSPPRRIHPYIHSSIHPSHACPPFLLTAAIPVFIYPSTHPSIHSRADFYLLCCWNEKSAI